MTKQSKKSQSSLDCHVANAPRNDGAIFFDRDGVINKDNHLIYRIDQLELFPESADIIAHCRGLGYKIFIATNQATIARGMLTEEGLKEIHDYMEAELLQQNPEAKIDKIYYCPCHPNATVEKYRTICTCRKPKSGMLFDAQKEFGINLEKSFMIGDRMSDIKAGAGAGCTTILVKTGMQKSKPIVSDLKIEDNLKADYEIEGLGEIPAILKG